MTQRSPIERMIEPIGTQPRVVLRGYAPVLYRGIGLFQYQPGMEPTPVWWTIYGSKLEELIDGTFTTSRIKRDEKRTTLDLRHITVESVSDVPVNLPSGVAYICDIAGLDVSRQYVMPPWRQA